MEKKLYPTTLNISKMYLFLQKQFPFFTTQKTAWEKGTKKVFRETKKGAKKVFR